MSEPAYTRLGRRRAPRASCSSSARELFTRYSYDELSMAAIAREAGISKALLYHYFPCKQAFFEATLEQAARRARRAAREPDPALAARRAARREPRRLPRAGSRSTRDGLPEADRLRGGGPARCASSSTRCATRRRAHPRRARAGDAPPPALRAAVRGWLWFMDGAVLDWLEHRDMDRARLRGLLLGALLGAGVSERRTDSACDAQDDDRAIVAARPAALVRRRRSRPTAVAASSAARPRRR